MENSRQPYQYVDSHELSACPHHKNGDDALARTWIGAGYVNTNTTKNLKLLWADSTNVGGNPWSAVPLKNGNILVGGNGSGWVREISRTHQLNYGY